MGTGCERGSGRSAELSDVTVMTEVLSDLGPDVGTDVERCKAISDPKLVGECTVGVVSAAASEAAEPEKLCEWVKEPTWRRECWFLMAEERASRGELKQAVELCARSGPFLEDCGLHLWMRDVDAVLDGPAKTRMAATEPELQALHDRWEPLVVGTTPDFSARYWRLVWSRVLEPIEPLSLAVCEDVGPLQRELCRLQGGRVYHQRLVEIGIEEGRPICEQEPVSVGALGQAHARLAVEADPLFDEVFDVVLEEFCQGRGVELPPSLADSVARGLLGLEEPPVDSRPVNAPSPR